MLTPEDETVHLWGLASDWAPLGTSVMVRRQSAPDLGLANFLYAVAPRDVEDLEADLAEATSAGRPRVIIESRTPPWVEAELLLRGWNIEHELRLVLDAAAPLAGAPAAHAVRRADDCDPDWSARAEMFRLDHLEEDARHGVIPRSAARTAATIGHRRDLERHVSYSCAQRLGEVAGFICHWKAPSGCGVIEDVFVHPEHRGHGVATTLLHHAVDALRDEGANHVSISAEIGDTPAHLYARLGFRPHRVARSCVSPTGQD